MGILVGDNRSSQIYLKSKEKACQSVGIASQILTYPGDLEPRALKAEIEELNGRDDVDGILVQLPLPSPISTPRESSPGIAPAKDVDGIHPFNLGLLLARTGRPPRLHPAGHPRADQVHGVPIEGRDVVVIGRSLIVGKPLAAMLTNENGDGDRLPQQDTGPGRDRRAGRHPDRRHGQAGLRRARVRQAGRGGHRRRQQRGLGQGPGPGLLRRRRQAPAQEIEEKGYTVVGDVDPRVIEGPAG